MKLCAACSRHYWETEACCPFCGPESWGGTSTGVTMLGVTLAAGIALMSCGSPASPDPTDSSGSYYAGPTSSEFNTSSIGDSATTDGAESSTGSTTDAAESTTTSGNADSTTTDNGGSYYAGPTSDDFGSSSGGTSSGTSVG